MYICFKISGHCIKLPSHLETRDHADRYTVAVVNGIHVVAGVQTKSTNTPETFLARRAN